MAWIYLIGSVDTPDRYKIGLTKAKDINERIKKLQTGNDEELFLVKSFETDTPYKLESMLHFRYSQKQILNEWYELSRDDVNDFLNVCEKLQNTIKALADNPFFNPT